MFSLTQLAPNRIEVLVDGVVVSNHLSADEAFSQCTAHLAKKPDADVRIRASSEKRVTWTKPPQKIDAAVGQAVNVGFKASASGLVSMSGAVSVKRVADGDVILEPLVLP